MLPFRFTWSFWVSFSSLLSFPFRATFPAGWLAGLSLSLWSWHGDMPCFALSVVSYQRTSQWGDLNTPRGKAARLHARTPGGLPVSRRGTFCRVAPSPVFVVRWKRPLGAGALLSAPSLPSHNQGGRQRTCAVPWRSWCCQ